MNILLYFQQLLPSTVPSVFSQCIKMRTLRLPHACDLCVCFWFLRIYQQQQQQQQHITGRKAQQQTTGGK